MPLNNSIRKVQVVSSKSQRKLVISWMINEVENCGTEQCIAAKAVHNFPKIFIQRSHKANREKARIWWKNRDSFLTAIETAANKSLHIVHRGLGGPAVRRSAIKAMTGRGRKRPEWKNVLHESLRDEFMRLRSAGVKINRVFLQEAAMALLLNDQVPVSVQEVEQETEREIADVISIRWIDDFCDRFRIVTRRRTGNKTLSPETIERNNKFLSHHLGVLKRMYDDGLDPSTVENYDETHMMIDMDNGCVLDFQGEKNVTYAEVSSGRDCFTVCFRISGRNGGRIEKPVVIFQNPNSNYPINGIADDIEGVTYRSSPTGWMSQQLFANYFGSPGIIEPLSGNRTRRLWIDSVRVHNHSDQLEMNLGTCQTELKRFQPNSTTVAQPLDQLLLRCFKSEWRKRWYAKRNELVCEGEYTNTGRVRNPGKYFFLRLVKEIVDELNGRTEHGMSLARRSLMICGLIPGLNGVWSVQQLTPKLREIVENNMEYFEGQDPNN